MERSGLISTWDADKAYAKANNWVRPAIFFSITGLIFPFLTARIPVGIALFFSAYCLFLGIGSAVLALRQVARRGSGWITHVEGVGLAVRPSLTALRAQRITSAVGISCAPVALVIEVALSHSILASIISVVMGLLVSVLFYYIYMSSTYHPSMKDRGSIIKLTPDHLEIHPLVDDSPAQIPWDLHPTIVGFEPMTPTFGQAPLMYVSIDGSEDKLVFDMTGTPIPFTWLERLTNYFAHNPDKLATLALPEGVALARAILQAP